MDCALPIHSKFCCRHELRLGTFAPRPRLNTPMWLSWEYGIRNLARRPVRSGLTLAALSIVVLLIMVVVGFIRGLEVSLAESGDPDVVLIYSVSAGENIESSAIAARTPGC